jgi:hypothetical protein
MEFNFSGHVLLSDQLRRLAKAGVQVVMHNTLAASDYGLLDETTLTKGRITGGRCCGAG